MRLSEFLKPNPAKPLVFTTNTAVMKLFLQKPWSANSSDLKIVHSAAGILRGMERRFRSKVKP